MLCSSVSAKAITRQYVIQKSESLSKSLLTLSSNQSRSRS